MPLEIFPAERSDFPEIARIDEIAMKNNGIKQVIDIAVAKEGIPRTAFFIDYLASGFDESKPQTFWKVIDSDTGEIVSVAKYSFQHEAHGEEVAPQEDPHQAKKKHVDVENKPPSPELRQLLTGELFRNWSEFVTEHAAGKPHAKLHYMATHPKHQRRGAATLLLQRGADEADRAGLDTFLQASEEGLQAYRKAGFEVMETYSLDLSEFGVNKTEVRRCMRRPAGKD